MQKSKIISNADYEKLIMHFCKQLEGSFKLSQNKIVNITLRNFRLLISVDSDKVEIITYLSLDSLVLFKVNYIVDSLEDEEYGLNKNYEILLSEVFMFGMVHSKEIKEKLNNYGKL